MNEVYKPGIFVVLLLLSPFLLKACTSSNKETTSQQAASEPESTALKSELLGDHKPEDSQSTKTAIPSTVLSPEQMAATNISCPGSSQELRDPASLRATNNVLQTNLVAKEAVKCVDGTPHLLQSYIDERAGTDDRPVGPTYVIEMGNTANPQMNIDFKNALGPADQSYDCGHHGADVGKCTNLHTHGFHVSPKTPQDNVFLKLSPADPTFNYRFDIPASHPPGTHWLHAHLHGSTAPQVKNGMAGALILKGEIDRWLADDYGVSGDKDKIMILQQLEDPDGNPLCGNAADGSARTTSINGQCLPTITTKAGVVMHWRLIHAGVSATVNFAVMNAYGETVTLREYARDGVTMQGAQDQEELTLQPGYRSDVLLKIPNCPNNEYPCTMTVVDGETAAFESLWGRAEPHNVIATVVVEELSVPEMRLPPSDAALFVSPYPFIPDEELEKKDGEFVTQQIWFANIPNPAGGTFKTVNGKVYPDGGTEQLKLNTATLWNIWVGEEQGTSGVNHPFHIHVNPFQVTDRDVNGRPFHFWKDTLLISGTDNLGKENAITVRSRYEDFDGKFVLHCHNLNHEDDGMMMDVEISR